jgi:hypothetical protein
MAVELPERRLGLIDVAQIEGVLSERSRCWVVAGDTAYATRCSLSKALRQLRSSDFLWVTESLAVSRWAVYSIEPAAVDPQLHTVRLRGGFVFRVTAFQRSALERSLISTGRVFRGDPLGRQARDCRAAGLPALPRTRVTPVSQVHSLGDINWDHPDGVA